PGGFSFGDYLRCGAIAALSPILGNIKEFALEGGLLLGICNGFQVLVKSGLLPGNRDLIQEVSLIINDSAKFEDRWVYLKGWQPATRSLQSKSRCVWTRGLPDIIYLPVAHGEGKFITPDKKTLERLKRNAQIVFQYCDEQGRLRGYPYNPNGSVNNIAGICDETGRILGIMPHPERHMDFFQHPHWQSIKKPRQPDGLLIFKNGVEYAKRYL
ncbi:MAG: phosphoribosylformylglycinamidine synthase I, partial [Candidatus Omnitrophica bacterium]|nr:phosphoribosylformylglycinamidine synthase I [Candidatus Omnitrophota bacterium]